MSAASHVTSLAAANPVSKVAVFAWAGRRLQVSVPTQLPLYQASPSLLDMRGGPGERLATVTIITRTQRHHEIQHPASCITYIISQGLWGIILFNRNCSHIISLK